MIYVIIAVCASKETRNIEETFEWKEGQELRRKHKPIGWFSGDTVTGSGRFIETQPQSSVHVDNVMMQSWWWLVEARASWIYMGLESLVPELGSSNPCMIYDIWVELTTSTNYLACSGRRRTTADLQLDTFIQSIWYVSALFALLCLTRTNYSLRLAGHPHPPSTSPSSQAHLPLVLLP